MALTSDSDDDGKAERFPNSDECFAPRWISGFKTIT